MSTSATPRLRISTINALHTYTPFAYTCVITLSGFMRLCGSKACLMARIAATPAVPISSSIRARFPRPMPCSPVHVPSSEIALLLGGVVGEGKREWNERSGVRRGHCTLESQARRTTLWRKKRLQCGTGKEMLQNTAVLGQKARNKGHRQFQARRQEKESRPFPFPRLL